MEGDILMAKRDEQREVERVDVPEIETELRSESRYGGVGQISEPDVDDVLEEPVGEPLTPEELEAAKAKAEVAAEEPAAEAAEPAEKEKEVEELAEKLEPARTSSPASESAPTPDELEAAFEARVAGDAKKSDSAAVPGTFHLIYESRDGKLVAFEDAAGHITAVRASKLASSDS